MECRKPQIICLLLIFVVVFGESSGFVHIPIPTQKTLPLQRAKAQPVLPRHPERENMNQLIYGKENEMVYVFISMNSAGTVLPCSSEQLGTKTWMNHVYKWTKDTGQKIQDSKHCSILENGSLAFNDFGPEQSGIYKCSVSYSKEGKHYTKHFHFFVRAYHRPDRSVEIRSAFYSALCSSAANSIYIRSFLQHLNGLVRNLSCEVIEKYTECIWPLQGRNRSEVRMTVLMFPYGVMWEIYCPPESMSKDCEQDIMDRSKEAYERIHRSIEVLNEFQFHEGNLPSLHYKAGSLLAYKVDHCKPGFGKSNTTDGCSNCCIACAPGLYSSLNTVTCVTCPLGSYNGHYGKTECETCTRSLVTYHKGATSSEDCVPSISRLVLLLCVFTFGVTPSILLVSVYIVVRLFFPRTKLGKVLLHKELEFLHKVTLCDESTSEKPGQECKRPREWQNSSQLLQAAPNAVRPFPVPVAPPAAI